MWIGGVESSGMVGCEGGEVGDVGTQMGGEVRKVGM